MYENQLPNNIKGIKEKQRWATLSLVCWLQVACDHSLSIFSLCRSHMKTRIFQLDYYSSFFIY